MISQNVMYIFPENIDEKTQIKYKVVIGENFEWSLTLYATALQRSNKYLQDLSTVLNGLNIQSDVDYILSYSHHRLCGCFVTQIGNKTAITNDSKEIVAFVENSNQTAF